MATKADRRPWAKEEVDVLLDVLEDLVVEGFKADVGQFKPGTYAMILAKIREKVPNAPDMNDKHCMSVDNTDVLDTYKKRNPKSKYQAGTPFPEYERLCNIFGKDHATGVIQINQHREREKCMAEQQQEQHQNAAAEEDGAAEIDNDNDNVGETATASPMNAGTPSSVPGSDASASARKGKRAREDDPFQNLVKTMQDFMIESKEERVEIRETIAEKKRKGPVEEAEAETETDELEAVMNELERLLLPMDTVMGAVYRMQVEPKHLKLFWRLRDDAKVIWAKKLASV
ncbi:hypothetical protein Tsubulata_006929 [Turnera subulata]|uniref:Myb/SANT-like domain-containing protein n=1 Tax=Turnera subulata TaxID=218843 RepID=A0A9Q0GCZ1_9ROSI|nr:hypothetical protein Tsubulata_006929 [Turnera subulata]